MSDDYKKAGTVYDYIDEILEADEERSNPAEEFRLFMRSHIFVPSNE